MLEFKGNPPLRARIIARIADAMLKHGENLIKRSYIIEPAGMPYVVGNGGEKSAQVQMSVRVTKFGRIAIPCFMTFVRGFALAATVLL